MRTPKRFNHVVANFFFINLLTLVVGIPGAPSVDDFNSVLISVARRPRVGLPLVADCLQPTAPALSELACVYINYRLR